MTNNKDIVKVYWAPCYRDTREHLFIKQGLVNNPRVKLVHNAEESDFIFQFYYIARHREFYKETFPPGKTVIIDYHDSPGFCMPIECIAYFKRSWTRSRNMGNYTARELTPHPPHFHPLPLAIMDEFKVIGELERDVALSCTLRNKERRPNKDRARVLKLLEKMDIKGNVQIGQFNKGNMLRFNFPDMREYFRLLKRSRIVVTCNPSRWEGDHRTWEAFANGALVFVDRTLTPLKHPLVDGRHCIFYDLSDKGLAELEEKIYWYLAHTDVASEIAKAGHEFTMKYHRTTNRIDEILDIIT